MKKIIAASLLLMLLFAACSTGESEPSVDNSVSNALSESSQQGGTSSEPVNHSEPTDNVRADAESSEAEPSSEYISKSEANQNSSQEAPLSTVPDVSYSTPESPPDNEYSVSIIRESMAFNGALPAKTFTDKDVVDAIKGYFSNLLESDIEMTPNTGGDVYTISIYEYGTTSTYRFNSPQRDGTLYCKDLSSTDWLSMTGWLVVADAGAYDYVVSLCE